ncbi:MAG: spermidine/putrescine ABC transporter ATP-binding protein [Treponema sp. GWB1_62_6]|nr:MAG: spermidine/putrescine ABC transporter ATP-binding protein [Treponema sp. GWA1_62_8]OHE64620.1 MAG: spermidine/putrescine ABC transporter ATP-binding protein [Treponema sp. GWC1_61_84]OHE68472.1 MAG: spermidine/putrescine ABC transporter ATP-binding protein [Treponema sp. GWB1_62_6]OHE74733.1 MAG: spermidine/putrescine ABC transporter ATP-binding protein [Treponema sp. RIFOXYC1_FULL_61_9]HCM28965.1 spermidine/putrescine ABC transporter ATP-binding protein [Treponema sp.]
MKGSDVKIERVSKAFGDFKALKDVSMEIKKGEFFSLLGPSGCGKTTLLRIIAGFETPNDGAVTLDGTDVLPLPPNMRHTNTVFQNYALFPHLSVYENVAFPLRIKKAKGSIIRERVGDYLKLVELEAHARKKPSQLSGGQKQRVAIARALINEPSVLLLDEPLSALDAKLRQHMLIELDRIHDKIGITFIYVTHDQQEALSVSDRIAVMNQGDVLQIGTPHEIYESPASDFVARFIGETNLFEGKVLAVEKFNGAPAGADVSMAELEIPELGRIKVTTVDEIRPGQSVAFSVRPEKIVITTDKPATKRRDINLIEGIVDEPIYSGFQTKFYVRLSEQAVFKVIKQHAVYSDEGPDIVWKDSVYLSWSADDGYIVSVKES